jgi:hypothetical protein
VYNIRKVYLGAKLFCGICVLKYNYLYYRIKQEKVAAPAVKLEVDSFPKTT